VEELKPEIVKAHYYGTYRQETSRILKSFICDIKRLHHQISTGQAYPVDKDIAELGSALKVLGLQFELMLAYKFPQECDISISDLKKHYNIGI
jgi:hypothetical protein